MDEGTLRYRKKKTTLVGSGQRPAFDKATETQLATCIGTLCIGHFCGTIKC